MPSSCGVANLGHPVGCLDKKIIPSHVQCPFLPTLFGNDKKIVLPIILYLVTQASTHFDCL